MMTVTEALDWIAELFEEPVENIQPATPREDIPGWDSLGTLTLMASLDEDFDIVLSDGEIQGFRSIEDILALLKRHGHLQ